MSTLLILITAWRPSVPLGQNAQVMRTDLPPEAGIDPDRPIRDWRTTMDDEGLHLGRWLIVAAVVTACIAFAWLVL